MKKQIYTTGLLILVTSGLILSLAGCDRDTNESKDASTKESTVIESTTEEVIEQDFTVSEIFPKLTVGESFPLTVTGNEALTYQSSDEAIVTASDGVLTAIAPGKAVVTISNDTGTVYVHVKVLEAVSEAEDVGSETATEVITHADGSTEVIQKPTVTSNGQTASNPATSSGSGKTGSAGTSSGNNTSTGSSSSGKTNTNTNTSAPAPTPSTEAPATEAPAQPTVYYYNWDYIIPRANEIIKQTCPTANIARGSSYQTLTDMDGFSNPLPFSDEAAAQDLANCVLNSMCRSWGVSDPSQLTYEQTGAVGVFLDSIETPGTNPNTPNLRYIHLTYYY